MYYLIYFFQNIWNYIFQLIFKKQSKAIENTISLFDLSKKYFEKQKYSFIDLLKTKQHYNANIIYD